jgi:hypothetical protein
MASGGETRVARPGQIQEYWAGSMDADSIETIRAIAINANSSLRN